VPRARVDPSFTVLFGRAGDQQFGPGHDPSDEVRQAALRVRRVPAAFEHDDVDVVTTAPLGDRCCLHPGGVAADHHDPQARHR
jgi:hypothetical protein